MPYLLIQSNARYFLPIMDSIGKRGIVFSWNSNDYSILIEGTDNINKVKNIWDIIKNGVDYYKEGVEES